MRTLNVALAAALLAASAGAGGGSALLRGGNVITVAGPTLQGADILVVDGIIRQVGENLQAPPGVPVIDCRGRWVMPGIIDAHSHIALEGGVNETGALLTPETDCADIIDPEDLDIFYALTGGVTSIHTMHGSANPIGGRGIVLKLRWGATAPEMVFAGAPRTVKWALGENPKQANSPDSTRYPKTRMGVEASIRAIFEEARSYQRAWRDHQRRAAAAAKAGKPAPLPPRRDLRLEVVSDILAGKLWVRCHAYQAAEMLSILKLCQEYGVKLAAFEHGLEAYKIADELAAAGVGNAAFADFWGYKWEAFFTLPHSVAMQVRRGVVAAVASDSAERMRRLNLDAAKTVRFGGLTPDEAIRTITINAATICGTDRWVGTIQVGKHADLAVFDRHPLDAYAVCQMTLVDGNVLFDRAAVLAERAAREARVREGAPPPTTQTPPPGGKS